MRYTDFTEDQSVAAVAEELGRALVDRRAVQQRAQLDRLMDAMRGGEDPSLMMERARPADLGPLGAPRSRPADDVEPVFGTAVIRHDGRYEPVLLVDERTVEAKPGQLLPAAELRSVAPLRKRLQTSGAPVPADLRALAMPEPVPYFAPGEPASGPGTTGTFGACVTDANGDDCILTAGHVAARGAQVTDASGATGTVLWSNDPASVAGPTPGADVAIVRPDAPPAPGGVAIAATATATAGDGLDVRGALTPAGTTQTMGFSESLYVPSMAGMWAQVYFTTGDASQPGDSGCPVLHSGTDRLIGHVVGGAPGMTSWIQAIDVQLRATACRLRPSP